MKPIKLVMQAFGPYKNQETVDFTQLEEHRLFLVTGNTGAGKTTIFDGIAFALYGHASGEDRKEHKSMRSDFADDNTHTLVQLTFKVRGRTYRVTRQLAHIKKGRKTASGENYEFVEILADGSEVLACESQKARDISQKIEELIGLTYDQFNQIVMLPQGEFRKLLTSNTENKEAILRKIFKTERYLKIPEQLELKKKQAEKQRDEAKAVRDSYIDQISGALPARDSELFERLNGDSNIYQIVESLKSEKDYYMAKQVEDELAYEEAQKSYGVIQQQFATIQQQNERLLHLQNQQATLQQQERLKPQYDAMQQEVEQGNIALQIAAVYEAAQMVTKELQQLQLTFTSLQQHYKEAEDQAEAATAQLRLEQQTESERKQLEQSIHELRKVEPLFNQVANLKQEIERANVQYEKIMRDSESCQQQITSTNEQLQQLYKDEENLQQQVASLPEKLVRKQKVEQILTYIYQYEQTMQNATAEEQTLQLHASKLQIAEQTYKELEQIWVSNQALQLAAHLVDGEPCPVCGSKEHELHNVQQSEQQVSKDLLQHKKDEYDAASRTYFSVEATYKATKAQLVQLQQQLAEQQIDVASKHTYEQEFTSLQQLTNELQHAQSLLQQAIQKRQSLHEQLQQIQAEYQNLTTRQQNALLYFEKKQVELQSLQQQIPSNYENLQQLQQQITEQSNRYDQLVKAFNVAQQAYEKARLQATRLQEAVHQTEQQLQSLVVKEQQQQAQWQQALQQSPFDTVEQFQAALRSRQQLETMQQQVTQFMQNLYALQQFVQRESEQLQNVQIVDVSEMQQQVEQQKRLAEQAYSVVNATKDCIQTCTKYEGNLNTIAEKIAQLEEVANNVINLYNVLRGQNTRKISFERYVQIGYLEQITQAANARLHVLSNGQYSLVSSERVLSHGRQSGLSLDVHDSYTGQVRDVKTLSGGEKFNASLCLALGMADVIQSFEGNVRIDTMFIDEGFGSLDEESLLRAIDTLIDLQKSGRMIGVISHVSELKVAIPAMLEVVKLKEGYSKTKITIKS